MKSILITVGNEVTSGHTVNTNAASIAKSLEDIGVTPKRVVTMRDDINDLSDEIRSAIKKYDLVIITGGLGPTHDDVTKPALLKAFKTKLVRDKKTLAHVKKYFADRNSPMPQINEGQADIPDGATPLRNKWGTAPGLFIEEDDFLLFALPGVPHEMKNLMSKEVLPITKKRMKGTDVILRTILHTVGIGESSLYTAIEKAGGIDDIVEVAYLPHMGQVDIRLTATGDDRKKARASLNLAIKKIRKAAGEYIYGRNGDTLESVIGRKLSQKGLTLASAESCTGGLFASRLTSVSGSSKYFLQGVVSYSDKSKAERLNVDEETIETFGAVSSQTAGEMAKGICETSGADIGLSSTGIAGPTGGTKEKPTGLVYIGLCVNGDVSVKVFSFKEDRKHNQQKTVVAMLTWLWRTI